MTVSAGLSREQLDDIKAIFRSVLAGQEPVKVFLFGSRARGDFKRYSDVDILIEGRVDSRRLRELKNALAESRLPFKCDVVPENEVFEHYRGQIESEKKPLFELNQPAPPNCSSSH